MTFFDENTILKSLLNQKEDSLRNSNDELLISLIMKNLASFPFISQGEIKETYLPLANVVFSSIKKYQNSFLEKSQNKNQDSKNIPFVIGVAGSVSSGKSTFSNILSIILKVLLDLKNIEIVSTDSFLYPTKILLQKDILNQKGFPISYDFKALIDFLKNLKNGEENLTTPIYSHKFYDIDPDNQHHINHSDILIIEGLNILQDNPEQNFNDANLKLRDFVDLSIYIDAKKEDLENWYFKRFNALMQEAKNNPNLFYHKYAHLSEEEAYKLGKNAWDNINLVNLIEYIEPTKDRAHLIIKKDSNHKIIDIKVQHQF